MEDYIKGVGNDVPFMLVGGAGTGKSSIMAKVADDTNTMAINGKIPGLVTTVFGGFKEYKGLLGNCRRVTSQNWYILVQ